MFATNRGHLHVVSYLISDWLNLKENRESKRIKCDSVREKGWKSPLKLYFLFETILPRVSDWLILTPFEIRYFTMDKCPFWAATRKGVALFSSHFR